MCTAKIVTTKKKNWVGGLQGATLPELPYIYKSKHKKYFYIDHM